MTDNPNHRWASAQIYNIWSDWNTALRMRMIWLDILRAQIQIGVIHDPHPDAYQAYTQVASRIDLDRINQLEHTTGHHLQAHLLAFEEAAGTDRDGNSFGLLHRGLTSCDITDLVTQSQVVESLNIIERHTVATLNRLTHRADDTRNWYTCGRTHGLPAQPTTIGRRLSTWIDQLLYACERLNHLQTHYPIRPPSGAVGNYNDLANLTQHKPTTELIIKIFTGGYFKARISTATGQTYHRILDLDLAATLTLLTAPLTNMAATLRAMVIQGHATEQPDPEQTGSSAMPHKRNPRHLERITALHRLLRGHLATLAATSADQLYEGDVADTAARRVAIPGAIMTTDGILCSAITALDRLRLHHGHIEADYQSWLPFMATGWLLDTATNRPTHPGQTRTELHDLLQQHARTALRLHDNGHPIRRATAEFRTLVDADPTIGLHDGDFDRLQKHPEQQAGYALEQTHSTINQAHTWLSSYSQDTLEWTPRGETL